MNVDISLAPQYIFNLGPLRVTNTFFTAVLVTLLLSLIALTFYLKFNRGARPSKLSLLLILFVDKLLQLTDSVTQNRGASKKILPLIATFFLFIVTSNLIALLPGFLGSFYVQLPSQKAALLRSPSSDLTITLALALTAVFAVQYFSLRNLGLRGYLRRFFNFSNPLNFVVGFFEMISEGIKVLSFSFRLFGNIFVGEVLLIIIGFLLPFILPLPFMFLEVFVGVIQAFIFAMLTLSFIKLGQKEVLSGGEAQ